MAKTTITHITDDLDGSKDAEEVAFSYEGTDYVIDLGKKNKAALDKALKPYIEAATKVSRRNATPPAKRRRATASTNKLDLAAVRAWAHSNDIAVSARGRIPKDVIAQYEAAHATTP